MTRPSEPERWEVRTLDLDTILARLDMVSGAPTLNIDASGGASSENPGGKCPGGESSSPADPFRARLAQLDVDYERKVQQAVDDHALDLADGWWLAQHARIQRAAEAELQALTGRTHEPPSRHEAVLDDPGKLAEMVLTEGEGHPADAVAVRFKLSPHMVRRIRRRAVDNNGEEQPRDPETGKPLVPEVANTIEERNRRARAMADSGMSERQIRLALGLNSTTQVRRALGRAA